jgi:hypothetical protein
MLGLIQANIFGCIPKEAVMNKAFGESGTIKRLRDVLNCKKRALLASAVALISVIAAAIYLLSNNAHTFELDGQSISPAHSPSGAYSSDDSTDTDIRLSDADDSISPSIPENETLRVDSPDGTYRAEAYGTNKNITAAGMYPYEGLRIIRNSDETTVWSGDGCYTADFVWSSNSKYAAVYTQARIYGECFIVDADTGSIIELPSAQTVSELLGASSQPSAERPDPYFRPVGWVNDTTVRVDYRWTAREGGRTVSGTYEYDIIDCNIVSNTYEINGPPG